MITYIVQSVFFAKLAIYIDSESEDREHRFPIFF
jgi:hypothetical protein